MPDHLRTLAADLLADPIAPPPPMRAVVGRAHRYRSRRTRVRGVVALAVLLLAGTVRVVSIELWADTQLASNTLPDPPATVPSVDGRLPSGRSVEPTVAGGSGPGLRCAPGANGGATDVGVTADTITLFMAVAPGESAAVATDVIDGFNAAGGACGRRVSVRLHQGSAPPPDDVFAVIGDDAPPPASLARIAVRDAYERAGARSFAFVYAGAFVDGADLEADMALFPGASTIVVQEAGAANSMANIDSACARGRCDVVVLAVPATTIAKWLATASAAAKVRVEAFTSAAAACAQAGAGACDRLSVWDPSYTSARRLVEAITAAGPALTREHLRATTDPSVARPSARALRYRRGSLVDAGTGWVTDPKGA
ncbi:MAG: hypothetical protein QOF60_970 [Actinomycetota bacterium]|nr:hypothetical protein [Actinomycetota bacterium]